MTFVNAILIIIACISASYYIWNYYRRTLNRFFARKEINLPGQKRIFGNFLRETSNEFLDLLSLMANYYPSPFQIWLNYRPFIVIYEPNQIKTILHSRQCLEKSETYKFVEYAFGKGLLTAPVSTWTQNRKIIVPNFNSVTLREFFDTFVEQSLIFANKLEEIGQNGNKIILQQHLSKCALGIACKAMLGIKIDSEIKNHYFEAVIRLKEILRHRMYSALVLSDFTFFNFIYNFTAFGREQQRILKMIQSLFTKRLNGSNKLHATPTIFLDNLMKTFCEKNSTQESISENILTLVVGASDTIGVALDFVLYMLANFPEKQEKVYKELEGIYSTETPTSAPVKYDDLQRMDYLDRAIKETMRLFPPLPIIGRKLTEDMKLGEFVLPKDSNIIIPFIRMNRNKKYWPNPLNFDPDRFLPERIKDCPSCYHIPFSSGPRDCIGKKYAMIAMKVILATLIRTFIFKVDKNVEIEKIKLKTDLSLSPVKPFSIRIQKRDISNNETV